MASILAFVSTPHESERGKPSNNGTSCAPLISPLPEVPLLRTVEPLSTASAAREVSLAFTGPGVIPMPGLATKNWLVLVSRLFPRQVPGRQSASEEHAAPGVVLAILHEPYLPAAAASELAAVVVGVFASSHAG